MISSGSTSESPVSSVPGAGVTPSTEWYGGAKCGGGAIISVLVTYSLGACAVCSGVASLSIVAQIASLGGAVCTGVSEALSNHRMGSGGAIAWCSSFLSLQPFDNRYVQQSTTTAAFTMQETTKTFNRSEVLV